MVKRGRKTGVYFQKVRVWVGKGQSRFAFRVYSVAAVAALRHTLGVCQNFPYANFLHVSRRRRGAYSRVYSRWACKREYTPKCLGWPRYFGVASTTRRRAGGASDYMRTRPGSRKSIRSSSARVYSVPARYVSIHAHMCARAHKTQGIRSVSYTHLTLPTNREV